MDMFASRFKKEGVMNPKTGSDYRKCILQPGGSVVSFELISCKPINGNILNDTVKSTNDVTFNVVFGMKLKITSELAGKTRVVMSE